MKIGDVARLFGVTTSKVRFLEAQGLVHPSRSSSNGYREYNETAVERISFILQAQSLGFRIEELRRVFAEGGGYPLRCDFVIERMTIKLDELRSDIERTCATRDRLIERINDAQARVRAQEQAGVTPRPAHPAAPVSVARPQGIVSLKQARERSTGRQQQRGRQQKREVVRKNYMR